MVVVVVVVIMSRNAQLAKPLPQAKAGFHSKLLSTAQQQQGLEVGGWYASGNQSNVDIKIIRESIAGSARYPVSIIMLERSLPKNPARRSAEFSEETTLNITVDLQYRKLLRNLPMDPIFSSLTNHCVSTFRTLTH